jgi:hypothetical protein
MITQEQIENRKTICNGCENLVPSLYPTCNCCACPINYLTQESSASCPIEKWPAITELSN